MHQQSRGGGRLPGRWVKEEKERGEEQEEEGEGEEARMEEGAGGQGRSGEGQLDKPAYPSQDLGIASKLEEIKQTNGKDQTYEYKEKEEDREYWQERPNISIRGKIQKDIINENIPEIDNAESQSKGPVRSPKILYLAITFKLYPYEATRGNRWIIQASRQKTQDKQERNNAGEPHSDQSAQAWRELQPKSRSLAEVVI